MNQLRGRASSSGNLLRGAVSVAVGLGVMALMNSVLASEAERRNPPGGKFMSVDGVRLHY